MPYPVFVIPFNQYLNYVNNNWITNGEGDITGIIGNNVVNAVYQYILTCPLNSSKVDLVSTTSSFQVTHGITWFYNQTPINVVFGDNFWGEWIFVNSTNNNIPFANGLGYFDINNVFQTNIPLSSRVRISKATSGQWFQTEGSINNNKVVIALRKYPQFTVGAASAPVFTNGGKTLSILDNELLNLMTEVIVEVDGQEVPQTFVPNFTDYFAYTPVYSTGRLTLNFNEAVPNLSVGIVRYPVPLTLTCPTNVTTLYTGETTDVQTVTLLDTNGNIFTIISGTTCNISINLLCNSTTNEIYAATYILSATNIAGALTISSPALTELRNDFGYDGNGDPLLIVQVLKDNTLQGVKVVVTGVDGFIINYEATFDSKSKTLSNA